jgi:hypothetical protein
MPKSVQSRRPQAGLLKYSYLLLSLNVGTSLKLTPVQHSTQRNDLSQEATLISNAFNEAKALISNDAGDSLELDVSSHLHSKTIKNLVNSIERWTFVEKRLQNGIANGDTSYQVLDCYHSKLEYNDSTLSAFLTNHSESINYNITNHQYELNYNIL